jgi:CRISPR-associated protein Csm1
LEQAKAYNPQNLIVAPKNAVSCFSQHMLWDEFEALLNQRLPELQRLTEKNGLSTGYVYGLLNLIDMAEKINEKPENALWHSYFAYRTARMLDRQKLGEDKQKAREERNRRYLELASEIAKAGIEQYKGKYRVALFCHLYQQRD